MRTRFGLIAALILSVFSMAPVAAQDADSSQREVVVLKPGQFVWYDTATVSRASVEPGNGISIIVSIPAQLAYVYRDGVLIAVSTISTGKPGKDTPPGEFTILQKQVFHRSNLYSAAPMPWMQRLTWDGIALHAGHLPGFPASHGCIRLPVAFAKKLYQVTGVGGMVSVTEEFVDDPRFNPSAPQPTLRVDMASLGGAAFDRVVARSDGAQARMIDTVQREPATTNFGPTREIVQPVPSSRHR